MPAASQLKELVREAYSAAAERPESRHAFPVGRCFAESVGYPKDVLDAIPECASAAFAGVSCVSLAAKIEPGMCVLDLGCGAGLDSLIAAKRVGRSGRVTGIDFSEPMLGRARQAVAEAGVTNVEFHLAESESLPCDDASFDVVLVNGIFNLNPARNAIFIELARVTRPSRSVWAAELVLEAPQTGKREFDEASWFA